MSAIASALAWLGPVGQAATRAWRWIRTASKGRRREIAIGALVAVILVLLWLLVSGRREAAFYRAAIAELKLSLVGTGQNERVLLARIADKDRTIDELRRRSTDDRCEGDWTKTVQPDGTTMYRCVGKSESRSEEELFKKILELEGRGPLPFIQPPQLPPPPSLQAAAKRSRWSAGAGAGRVKQAADWAWTGYGRAGYRVAGPWALEATVLAPVWGGLLGVSLTP